MPQTYLVSLDGSEPSLKALDWALSVAKPGVDQLHLLCVVEPPSNMVFAAPEFAADIEGWNREYIKIETKRATEVLQNAEEKVKHAGFSPSTHLQVGQPRDQIVDFAKKHSIDTIIMGSRGLGALKRMLLGSVSDYVLHHASCATVIVRSEDPKSSHA